MKSRSLLFTFILFAFILGNGMTVQAMPYSAPPDWMPMTMLGITFDPASNKLAITPTTFAAPLATNTTMMGMPAAGVASFDPAQPYAVLNNTAFSRRFGWWDPNENSSTPILPTVRAFYGPNANIWIQSLTKSPGLNSYQAVGADGLQMGNNYPGIFGTAGSTTKWLWDGMMDHNTYAVPFSAITKPNQFFSAYYKIYVGDATGNELMVNGSGSPVASAATTTTWGWQGPPFVFTSQTGVAAGTSVESDVYTHTDASAPVSISGGEYALSIDGGLTWGAWTAAPATINTNDRVKVRQSSSPNPGTTTTAILTIPTATGPGTFSVTTLGPVTTPTAFSFTSQSSVPVSTLIESSSITVAGINTEVPISVSAGGEYAVSIDDGTSWSGWSNTLPAKVEKGNRVKVRLYSSATPGTTTSTTLTIGGVSAAFVVTTGNPVTPQLFFTPVSNAPANTAISGMPFYVTSNAIAASADSGISVSGGITPQYQVSTDNGVSWSAWSNTTPATVASGNLVRVRVVPASTPFTTTITKLTMGSTVAGFSVTTAYLNPPSWMPMAMLNVALNGSTAELSVQDLHSHPSFPGTAVPALTYIPAGSYDPSKPWSVLNNGAAISRQLGWDDNTALHGNGITVPGNLLNQVHATYGSSAGIWIECTAKSPGLETYFADGMFGVGGTGNGASGTPQVYTNTTTGLPIVYDNNYYGIFGTDGSSSKWQWDGTMIHNVYAVGTQYITEPNQLFSATYRVYIGDSAGNDIAPEAATTEVWTWKGPAAVPDNVPDPFTIAAQSGVALNTLVESEPVTLAGLTVPVLISITGGEYSVSIDNGSSWSAFSATSPLFVANGNLVKVRQTSSAIQATTTTASLTIGGVTGAFAITTLDTVPDSFSFSSRLGVATGSVIESEEITVAGIDSPAPVSISAGEYAVSSDNGSTWSAYSTNVPATVTNGNRIKVRQTSSSTVYTTTTTVLDLGGVIGSFDVTTAPPVPENSYAVNALVSGTGGTIAPSGKIVKNGDQTSFTVKPGYGYEIASVSGCGGTLSGGHYLTGPITSHCTVTATFNAAPLVLTITSKPLQTRYREKSAVIKFTVTGAATREELAVSVTTSAAWITAGPLTYANGKGGLRFTAAENSSNAARTGSITIAGQTYSISQAAKPAKLAVTASSTKLAAPGGSVTVNVSVDPNDGNWSVSKVKWTPDTTTGWLTGYTVGDVISGSATLTLTAGANESGKPRSALLTLQSSDNKSRKSVKIVQAK